MTAWAGRYLVAGQTAYRITADDDTTLTAVIIAPQSRVHGRTVHIPKSNAEANIRLGFETLASQPPAPDARPDDSPPAQPQFAGQDAAPKKKKRAAATVAAAPKKGRVTW